MIKTSDKNNNKDNVLDMINNIELLYNSKNPMLDKITDIHLLYDALWDLHDVIGMNDIKNSIIVLLKFLMINTENNTDKFDNHMLHTLIYGSPGTGKTMIGSILAKIWGSLGLLKKQTHQMYEDKQEMSDEDIKNIIFGKLKIIKHDASVNINPNLKSNNNASTQTPSISQPKTPSIPPPITSTTLPPSLYDKSKLPVIQRKPHSLIKYVAKETQTESQINIDKTTTQPQEQIKKTRLKRMHYKAPIRIVSRNDFVAQYLGQSADKTFKLLCDTMRAGHALFIDEAYSLINDNRDSYGIEVLNEINKFMSEHPELIIIFAGYKDKIEESLFKYQPGFKRRCTWIFEINNYTSKMLAFIFKKQLIESQWICGENSDVLDKFFETNQKYFNSFGGDTLKLTLYCKLIYSEMRFDETIGNKDNDENIDKLTLFKTIDMDILNKAFEQYKANTVINQDDKFNASVMAMYV